MTITNELQYENALKRVEELMLLVDDETPLADPNSVELDLLVDMVEKYEDVHYPIATQAHSERSRFPQVAAAVL
jgi:HTH-type transcriptional regulator/antitoxin HigA